MINLAVLADDGEIEAYLKQLATEGGLTRSTSGTMLLISVLVGLTLALFLVVYLLRRKRRQGLSRSPHPPSFSRKAARKNAAAAQADRRRRKWHRRRREHRPRNPTLAETGGLPPIRGGDQPPPT